VVELNLDRLELGRQTLELDAELVREDPEAETGELRATISGELIVDAMDQRIVVHGGFSATHNVHCDRCALGFQLDTEPEIEVMILRNPSRGDEPENQDDTWVIHQRNGAVDLDESLLEAILLAEPQKILCREDCQGLCPRCGTNWNERRCECTTEEIDSRWAALAKLKMEDPEDDLPHQE
jgi:uncharacterized protein